MKKKMCKCIFLQEEMHFLLMMIFQISIVRKFGTKINKSSDSSGN